MPSVFDHFAISCRMCELSITAGASLHHKGPQAMHICGSSYPFQDSTKPARVWPAQAALQEPADGYDAAADFFISALNTRLLYIVIGIFVVYLAVFFFFAIFWYIAGQ